MTAPQISPYGSWKSPITSDLIVAGSIGLGQIKLDRQDIYWSESRPSEGGRNVIMHRSPEGITTEKTPLPFNARTRVHEYGGGAFLAADGVVYFSNFSDQRLYRQSGDAAPLPLTSAESLRYADAVFDRAHNRLICVREDHQVADREAVNTIVAIPLGEAEAEQTILASGHDFYASPRLSPDGLSLAWISWNHPNMPWDGTDLWVAHVQSDGSLSDPQHIAGGKQESIFQPEWSPDGVLYFVSDRAGWWNFDRWHPQGEVESVLTLEAEFGLPQWVFGMSTYGFADSDKILCTYTQNGISHLAILDLTTRELAPLDCPYTSIAGLQVNQGQAAFVGGSATEPSAIVQLDLTAKTFKVLQRASELSIDASYLSAPEAIEFPTENGLTAYALYYAPKNRDYTAPNGERPPLLVKSHGGPTASTSASLNLGIQYWTSRGFAVLDVNYGGSTGYGRAYRQRLNNQWGIVDVDDCANGAKYLTAQGKVDGDRLVIAGGSAGGYTTLCALTFRNTFKAGASYYGVSDLKALAEDTHKFESRYLDSLIGAYPAQKDLYDQRSPISAVDRLACPVIFFQGDEDKIVPPNQAEMMVNALRDKGIPVAYVLFEGEQHGFRKAENIKRALDGEFYFYSRVFKFYPAEHIDAVTIDNLP
ncbi:S9 family peptidase [Phormidesmis priestleyi ULC007]|uniref:S9 family peptidase n=1 Tax=Phormidesmis priestleyi ULC007 TaxID=1920490 RepID=A0A2T1D6R5_9CYAN|nr:S9 family peptidase [Phormidesmis priestleyi]PSB16180.1 S9 family peptidase [Phormidesmis priestleyi ULC007]PZO46919.1 MAG: S9 family peptidase [Phormidesmis priestleyi]